ncbi:uncharacterized protein ELE39_000427 [Cryptosporidium sp. chipmunk genotype I]|uniref:uncharacterized protein n=1 Tax=Cryptosporidium sp. chipmunk genotype I TaxID=1280935 RepID=UPI00351AA9CC|nr:hypothetical protein ELE39_000427 [Cryptosporidium sp. chipmunk genotype I]
MVRIIGRHYESLLETDSYTENEAGAELIVADDIFMYHQVNYLNKCLVALLLICHCFHILLFGGDVSPSIYRFKMDDSGVFALVLNTLVPCLFFVQGWLKALEIHKYTSFITRLHLEYIIPIFIYILLYLISILFKNDTQLENLTNEEFRRLLSQSGCFNPGFLSTFVMLFMVNLILDSIALVIVPNFYTSDTLIFFTVDISKSKLNNSDGGIPNNMNEKKYFSILKKFSFFKLIYCLLMVSLYDSLVNFLNDMGPKYVFIQSRTYNIFSVLTLLILCKILRNKPRILYFICLIGAFTNLIICSSFGSYINSHSFTSIITAFHFLLNIYFSGILISCMRLNIFNKWSFSIFFLIFSVLCYMISIDYSRSIISPLIFPSVLSIKSRFLTVSQIYSSIFAILNISILLFKYISIDSDSTSKSSRALNSKMFCFFAMLCTSSIKLFFE